MACGDGMPGQEGTGNKEACMRTGFILLVVALFSMVMGITPCRGIELPEISTERISVTLDPTSHLLTGESTLTVKPHGVMKLLFSLHPGATVRLVSVAGTVMPVEFSRGTLVVTLPPETRQADLLVRIAYSAFFNDPLPERTATAEDPTYGVNGVISAEGTFLEGGVAWYPRLSVMPAGRTVEVTAPTGFEAITAGRCLSRRSGAEKSVSIWEEAHPAAYLSLSAGRYHISERKFGSLPLYAYFSPANAPLAAAYLDASADYLKFYEELFGPYPFEKFAIVENFIPTGYGFPSYTLLGGTVLRLPFIIGTSLPHEIAHNWWGNGVQVDNREGNWSEGLVTYLADYLLEERKSPAAGRDYRLRMLTEYASLVAATNDFPLKAFFARNDPASRAIGYSKGAMVFHMIRTQLGDEAFFGALRELCLARLYQTASWADFMQVFSRHAGRDLTPFVNQWLTRTRGPRLSLAAVESRPVEGGWLVSGKIIQSPPPWAIPVNLSMATAGGVFRQSVTINQLSTPFTFTLPAPPRQLVLDPDTDLFRMLAREEIPPAINKIKGSRDLIAIITQGCRASRETLTLLLDSLGQKGAGIVREDEIKNLDLAGHDLLVCGVPARKELLPELPVGMTVSPQEFAGDHEAFASSLNTLFVVGRHPSARDHVAALYLPLSKAAADACLTKITHYGRFGYLVFSGGENRKKGTLPAAGGGTVVNF